MAGNVTERSIKLNVTAEADPSMLSNLDRFAKQAEERISLRKPDPIIEAFTPNWREKAMSQELLRLAEEADAEAEKSHSNRVAMIREEHSLFKQTEEEKRREEEKTRYQSRLRAMAERQAQEEASKPRFETSEEEQKLFAAKIARQQSENQWLDEAIHKEEQRNDAIRLREWLQKSWLEKNRREVTERQDADADAENQRRRLEVARRLDQSYGRTGASTVDFAQTPLGRSLAEEAAADQRRIQNAQTLGRLEEAMHADRRRAMSTEDRINDDHAQRVATIRRELNLTQQQTDELIRQSGLIRDQALVRNQRTIEFERRNAALHASGQNARMGPMFQEVGRGMEDFIVGFSMAKNSAEGMALGLRGAANNVGQIAALSGLAVAPYIAIGAALSTVIVPKMMEWAGKQFDNTKDLEKYKDELKQVIDLENNRSKARIAARNIETIDEAEKAKKKALEEREVIENRLAALVKKQTEAHKELARAMENEAKYNERQARLVGLTTIPGTKIPIADPLMAPAALGRDFERWASGQSGQVAAAMPEVEAIDKAVKDAQGELNKTAEELRSLEDESDRIKAQHFIKMAQDRAKFVGESVEKEGKLAEKISGELLDDEARAKNDKRLQYERDYYDNKKNIDETFRHDEAKRNELHQLNMSAFNARVDRMHREENRDAALKSIDEQIEAQRAKIEGLQDRQSNPNGPSSHAFFGSQTTASIINRAISGSATVEDTLKSQLKVEKEQLKKLDALRRATVVSLKP